MSNRVKGSFTIRTQPRPTDETLTRLGAMSMTFDKHFTGSLEGHGTVAMMGVMNQEIGSGAYVALEKFDGELVGRRGSFLLQHASVMERGKPTQRITVVPDSGTDELAGLKGEMTIDIVGGDHFYTFRFDL